MLALRQLTTASVSSSQTPAIAVIDREESEYDPTDPEINL